MKAKNKAGLPLLGFFLVSAVVFTRVRASAPSHAQRLDNEQNKYVTQNKKLWMTFSAICDFMTFVTKQFSLFFHRHALHTAMEKIHQNVTHILVFPS